MAELQAGWLDEPVLRGQGTAVAARALRDNPMSLVLSDDPLMRTEILHGAFEMVVENGPAPVGVRVGNCLLAIAAYAPPGQCISSILPPADRQLSDPPSSASELDRFLHCGSVMADRDLLEEHCHVGPVGVEPGFQGKGIGSLVLTTLCDRFDEQHELAWLETDKPENVAFYRRHGFEVADEVDVLSAKFWFMRRDPR